MTTITHNSHLPEPIVLALRSMVSRSRAVIIVRGLGAVAAVAVASLLVIMAVDATVMIIATWPRWLMTLGSLALTLGAAAWFLLRPLAKSYTLAGVAWMIESRHPEFHERVSSAVQLLSSTDAQELRGSQQLIEALAIQALADAKLMEPKREVRLKAAAPFLAAAGAVVAVLAALLIVAPSVTSRLLARAVAPYRNDLPNFYGNDLTVSPGNTVIPQGAALTIELSVAKPVSGAQLRRMVGNKDEVIDQMAPTAPKDSPRPKFTFTCQPATETFTYRVSAGDAISGYYTARVEPKPEITNLDVRYEFPAYTGSKPQDDRSSQGEIRAVAGTTVTIMAATNKPVAAAALLINDQPAPGAAAHMSSGPENTGLCSFKMVLTPQLRAQYAIKVTDANGFQNTLQKHVIEAVADAPPIVTIAQPATPQLRLKPTDTLPIVYGAGDDFGLSALELLITVDGGKQLPPLPLELTPAAGQTTDLAHVREVAGRTLLDLSQPKLKGARRITFQIRAADNLPVASGGPQQAFSPLYTIDADASAATYMAQVELSDEVQIRAKLEKALAQLQAAREISKHVAKFMEKAPAVNQAMSKKVDEIRQDLGAADTLVRDCIQVAAGGTFAGLADKLTVVADDHITKAFNLAGQIRLCDTREQRFECADEADSHIDRAIEKITEMLKEFNSMADLVRKAQELAQLAHEERRATIEAMTTTAPTPQQINNWKQAQQDVAQKMGQMVKADPQATKAQEQQDSKEAKDLSAEAKLLAAQQAQIAGATEKAAQLQDLDAAMKALAGKQDALAKQAAADKSTTQPAKSMAQAASDIGNAALPDAIKNQDQAAAALAEKAGQLNKDKAAADTLLQQAQQLAKDQQDIAAKAAASDAAQQAAATQLSTDKQNADDAAKASAAAGAKLNADSEAAQKRQNDLSAASKKLEQQTAADPAAGEAKNTKPSQAMDAAAKEMIPARAQQAKAAVASAAQQAEKLAQQLEAAHNAAPAQAQAAAEATEARRIASEQKKLSDEVAQAADQAAATDAAATAAANQLKAQQAQHAKAMADAQAAMTALAKPQQGLSDKAAALAKQAGESTDNAKVAAQANDAAAAMKAASDAMKKADAPKPADDGAQAAAQKAAQLAQTLAGAGAPDELAKKSQAASNLAAQQQALKNETAQLMAKRDALLAEANAGQLQRLKDEQAKLAKDAADVSDKVKSLTPQADRLDTHALRAAQEAAGQLNENHLPQAAAAATDAADKLHDLAGRLKKESDAARQDAANQQEPEGSDPQALTPQQKKTQLADEAADVARRQQQLAREVKDLSQNNVKDLAASRQEELQQQAAELAKDLALLRDHAADLVPDKSTAAEAHNAMSEMTKAQQAQQAAQGQIHAGQMHGAAPQQQNAAQSMQAAAAALDRMGQKLLDAAAKAPPSSDKDKEPDAAQLSKTFEAADKAAHSGQLSDSEKAAQMLTALAKATSDRAEAMGLMPMALYEAKASQMLSAKESKSGAGAMGISLSEQRLKAMGYTASDWAKLPGELRSEILQAAEDNGPKEYRELVKKYFEELSKRGSLSKEEEKK